MLKYNLKLLKKAASQFPFGQQKTSTNNQNLDLNNIIDLEVQENEVT